jgi:antitoxin component YwqK of YwqJK toxin-antitoxin module
MEVVIMELRELLLIKNFRTYFILILCLSLFISCKHNEQAQNKVPETFVATTDLLLSKRGQTVKYKDEAFSGWLYGLYENGDSSFITRYYNGKEDGISKAWYPNKQLMEIRLFVQGEKTGEHKGWWENGQQKYIFHYKHDLFEGNLKEWNINGVLFRDGNFLNGKEHGLQKFWRPDGKLYANYVVKNGRNYGLTGVKNCKNVGEDIKN